METTVHDIVVGLPSELQLFYRYCREGIGFTERPDYGYLKGLIWQLMFRIQARVVMAFHWDVHSGDELNNAKLQLLNERLEGWHQERVELTEQAIAHRYKQSSDDNSSADGNESEKSLQARIELDAD